MWGTGEQIDLTVRIGGKSKTGFHQQVVVRSLSPHVPVPYDHQVIMLQTYIPTDMLSFVPQQAGDFSLGRARFTVWPSNAVEQACAALGGHFAS